MLVLMFIAVNSLKLAPGVPSVEGRELRHLLAPTKKDGKKSVTKGKKKSKERK